VSLSIHQAFLFLVDPRKENQLMTSKHLIDPELLQILKQMPSLETTSETLSRMRQAMSGWKLAAPIATDVDRAENL
jgi:hypothetical protein